MRLNNLKIRTKLVIIYIFCVLVPLVMTNSFINYSVRQRVIEQQTVEMTNAVERIANSFDETINAALLVSSYLSFDERVYTYLSTEYDDALDYYNAFYHFMNRNIINYYYITQSIYDISLYTDNDTITNGYLFFEKERVEDEEWYQKFVASGKNTMLCSYYDWTGSYAKNRERAKHISIIRKSQKGNNIVKVDTDYIQLGKSINNESSNADAYLCMDGKILYTNVHLDSAHYDYSDVSEIRKRDLTIHKQITVAGEKLDIYVANDIPAYMTELMRNKYLLVLMLVVNLLLPSIVIILINRSFRNRIVLTEQYIKKVENGVFEEINCREGGDEIGNLIHSYNLMAVKIKELIEVVYRKNVEQQALTISRKQAELNALQSQINPHFMFNTLDSVRMRSLVKGEMETADILEKFAHLIRRVIHWDKDFVTIQEEVSYVKDYLDIQKYRFGERLSFRIQVNQDCKLFRIPKFSLLNFVENACIHGVERRIAGGEINVIVSKDEENLFLEVMDSGEGMSGQDLEVLRGKIANACMEDLNESKSIGVLNTVIRLKLFYGENIKISINSTKGEGTEICVMLPLTCNENLKNS